MWSCHSKKLDYKTTTTTVDQEFSKITRFYPFVKKTFNVTSQLPKILVYSTLLMLRKQLCFHFEIGSGLGKIQDDTVYASRQRIDLTLFHERCLNLARCVGFHDQNNAVMDIIEMMNTLKTVEVPTKVNVQKEDLDFMANMLKLSTFDIKSLWLDNTTTCFCPKDDRGPHLLVSAFLEICTTKILTTEKCSLQVARQKAALTTEDEVVFGVFRLALELWSLDFDLVEGSDKYDTSIKDLFSDSSKIPSTLQVVMDENGTPITVIPKRVKRLSEFPKVDEQSSDYTDHYQLYANNNRRHDIERDDSVKFLQSDKMCDRDHQIKHVDRCGLDLRFNISTNLEHPYCQLLTHILVSQRHYPAKVATKMLQWYFLPSNCCIPFPLLLSILNKCHDPNVDDKNNNFVMSTKKVGGSSCPERPSFERPCGEHPENSEFLKGAMAPVIY